MHLKLPILFLTAILGVSFLGGLVLGCSLLKERWEPRIEYLDDYLPVDPDETEFIFGGGGYLDEKCDCRSLIYTSWNAKRFRVTIEGFSEELEVLDGSKTVEAVPYVLQEGNLPEERCIWLGFTVVMPNQTGTYEVDLIIRLYSWLFSREYSWKYTLTADLFVPKSEESLSITIDKEKYCQGDTMTITIENISNETIWFTDTACNLFFERFNDQHWEFYDAMVGGLAMTPLEPNETKKFTWKLGYPGRPYPAGRYRVGTKGVYAEFEVIEVELIEAKLEKIVVEFLKTTDVPNGVWDGTVEVREVYDHKLGGKVVVVEYTTANGGHPGFFLEAFEHHIAVITLNMRGEVVSAFCVWGSFHDGKIWDLLNQRWIQQAMLSEQQAIDIGKGFLDGIGCTTGKVLSTSLEEKTANFYWHDLAKSLVISVKTASILAIRSY
ncbi:MAG: hypothetical protein OEY81_05715 [Candidatus Bathyarchaeota archaeon]|nr:hypothetical protein [Candidatus Bathyarchaeota archaeon]